MTPPTSRTIPEPPRARIAPTRIETHGVVRVDDYYWLRERDNPEVTAYLEAENEHTRAVMAPTEALQETLFAEIKGRIKQTDMSVPYREGDYTYYTRYEDGREYPIYCRRPIESPHPSPRPSEQVLLDVNLVAEGHDFCQVSGRQVSPDQCLLAYATDLEGRRVHTIRITDLTTGKTLGDELTGVTSNLVWANDSRTLFYTRQDPATLRWCRVYRHRLGASQTDDILVYEELDETFNCEVGNSRSKRYLLIASYQTVSTEYRYLDADEPDGSFTVFLARARDHEYHLDHYRDRFYIRTNRDARNFKLMEAADGQLDPDAWVELIPHREDVLLGRFELFTDYLVVQERRGGLIHLRVRPWVGEGAHDIAFDEPTYDAYLSTNREADTQVLRFGYESLTTPVSTYDYDMVTRTRTLRKREEVLGDFDPSRYRAERLTATSPDGESIPISLVFRVGTARDGTTPLLLYGYGAYGISIDATFNSARLSLLDRGFVFAIAHVRGGQELGRRWYDDGRLANKPNTFSDFIACADHLVAERFTNPARLFVMGGSAGGMLVGAVINMRPDLFAGAVADVPFVDVVTTMLDDSIPLTTGEYDEWGNPHERAAFDDILAYSPYDNVEAKDYPSLLVLAGLHDSQVQYWEPAKWVAKLRAVKTDTNRLLLKTSMDAGHGGVSGRYRQYRETALQYAFLLAEAGLA
ncbi:MAG: S9 family peptidase [Acidobacteria bacterium]|nr:MAG: S9 family peptidase [Acidobacteriota bacterium]